MVSAHHLEQGTRASVTLDGLELTVLKIFLSASQLHV